MIPWADNLAENLWRAGLAVVPLTLVVAAVCRLTPMRPATRHALWLLVLAWFVLPMALPLPPIADGFTFGVLETVPVPATPPVAPASVGQALSTEPSVPAPAPRVAGVTPRQPAVPAVAGTNPSDVARTAVSVGEWKQGRPTQSFAVPSAATSPTVTAPSRETSRSSDAPVFTGKPSAAPAQAAKQPSSIRHEPRRQGLLAPPAGSGGSSQPSRPAAIAPLASASAAPHGSLSSPVALPEARAVPSRAGSAELGDDERHGTSDASVASDVSTKPMNPSEPGAAREPGDMPPAWYVAWIHAANNVRRAIVQLPPLPAWLWLIGVAAVVCGCLAATVRFAIRLGRAQPASREIQKAVAAAAAEMGLRNVPRAYVVDARVSPLVWCGWRPRLILPRRLWADLDAAGRAAVLCHELAHLKRRDHWVRWGELLICAAYWWHPLAWWVRRRLSEEAENCCDAWVTWLLPNERRAYAQALLRANQFTTGSQHAAAPMGLGVLSGRAKRMARRLTMVMTHSTRPGLSGTGVALAVALGLAGWSTTPLWACPKKAKQTTSVTTPVAECLTVAVPSVAPPAPTPAAVAPAFMRYAGTPRPVRAALPVLFAGGGADGQPAQGRVLSTRAPSAPVVAIASSGGAAAAADDELAERLAALEQDLARLTEQLAEVSAAAERGARPRGVARSAPAGRAAAQAERERMLAETKPGEAVAPRAQARRQAAVAEALAAEAMRADEELSKAYRLSQGKLEALTELLKRDDVPLRIRPGNGEVEVLGPAAQQQRVEAFIGLLDDALLWREYTLASGKLEAFSELMVRSDVPIFVQPRPNSINIKATAAQHRVIEAFLREVDPELEAGEAQKEEAPEKSERQRQKAAEEAEAQRSSEAGSPFGLTIPVSPVWLPEGVRATAPVGIDNEAPSVVESQPMLRLLSGLDAFAAVDGDPGRHDALAYAEQLKQQAAALAAQADSTRGEYEALMAQVQAYSADIESFQRHAGVFGEQADELEERVDALHESGREPARQQAAAMRERAVGVEAQIEVMESQADELRERAEQLEEQAAGLREAAEALRATADELIERFGAGRTR